jgi:hypothetical protein
MPSTYIDYNVNPFNSDAIEYIEIKSQYYTGDNPNVRAPAVANYPIASPTMYFLTLPYIIDITDTTARPIALRDITNSVNLTRVTTSPGVNEYRISPTTSNKRCVIELNATQAASLIGYSFYTYGSVLVGSLMGKDTVKVCSSDSPNQNADYIIDTAEDAGAALQSIVDLMEAGVGGVILCEAGTYNFTSQLLIGDGYVTKVSLRGMGYATNFVRDAGYTTKEACISIYGTYIENIRFTGTIESASFDTSNAAHHSAVLCTEGVVRNCYVNNYTVAFHLEQGKALNNVLSHVWCGAIVYSLQSKTELNGIKASGALSGSILAYGVSKVLNIDVTDCSLTGITGALFVDNIFYYNADILGHIDACINIQNMRITNCETTANATGGIFVNCYNISNISIMEFTFSDTTTDNRFFYLCRNMTNISAINIRSDKTGSGRPYVLYYECYGISNTFTSDCFYSGTTDPTVFQSCKGMLLNRCHVTNYLVASNDYYSACYVGHHTSDAIADPYGDDQVGSGWNSSDSYSFVG